MIWPIMVTYTGAYDPFGTRRQQYVGNIRRGMARVNHTICLSYTKIGTSQVKPRGLWLSPPHATVICFRRFPKELCILQIQIPQNLSEPEVDLFNRLAAMRK